MESEKNEVKEMSQEQANVQKEPVVDKLAWLTPRFYFFIACAMGLVGLVMSYFVLKTNESVGVLFSGGSVSSFISRASNGLMSLQWLLLSYYNLLLLEIIVIVLVAIYLIKKKKNHLESQILLGFSGAQLLMTILNIGKLNLIAQIITTGMSIARNMNQSIFGNSSILPWSNNVSSATQSVDGFGPGMKLLMLINLGFVAYLIYVFVKSNYFQFDAVPKVVANNNIVVANEDVDSESVETARQEQVEPVSVEKAVNENINKPDQWAWLTPRFIFIVAGAMGLVGLLTGLLALMLNGVVQQIFAGANLSDLVSGLGNLYLMLQLFILGYHNLLVLEVIVIVLAALLIFKRKLRHLWTEILLGATGIELLLSLIGYGKVGVLERLMRGDVSGIAEMTRSATHNFTQVPGQKEVEQISTAAQGFGIGLILLFVFNLVIVSYLIFVFVKSNQFKFDSGDFALGVDPSVSGQVITDNLGQVKTLAVDQASVVKNQIKSIDWNKIIHHKAFIPSCVGAGLALLAALIGPSIYKQLTKTPVDLMSGCSVEVSGLNGYGKLDYHCYADTSKIKEDISEFTNQVTYHASRESYLKNGHKIKISAQYPKEVAEKYNLNVQNAEMIYKVKGLSKPLTKPSQIEKNDVKEITDFALRKIKRLDYSYYDPDELTPKKIELKRVFYTTGSEGMDLKLVYRADFEDEYGDLHTYTPEVVIPNLVPDKHGSVENSWAHSDVTIDDNDEIDEDYWDDDVDDYYEGEKSVSVDDFVNSTESKSRSKRSTDTNGEATKTKDDADSDQTATEETREDLLKLIAGDYTVEGIGNASLITRITEDGILFHSKGHSAPVPNEDGLFETDRSFETDKIGKVRRINDYLIELEIDEVKLENQPGTVLSQDATSKEVASEATLKVGDTCLVYLKGTPVSDYPREYLAGPILGETVEESDNATETKMNVIVINKTPYCNSELAQKFGKERFGEFPQPKQEETKKDDTEKKDTKKKDKKTKSSKKDKKSKKKKSKKKKSKYAKLFQQLAGDYSYAMPTPHGSVELIFHEEGSLTIHKLFNYDLETVQEGIENIKLEKPVKQEDGSYVFKVKSTSIEGKPGDKRQDEKGLTYTVMEGPDYQEEDEFTFYFPGTDKTTFEENLRDFIVTDGSDKTDTIVIKTSKGGYFLKVKDEEE